MDSEISCHFTIVGDGFDPAELSGRLGLRATSDWRKGDLVGRSSIRRKNDGWKYSISEQKTVDLPAMVKALLEILAPFSDAIREECRHKGLSAELSCVLHVGSPAPVVHFDVSVLSMLSRLGAEIDVDIYTIPDDEA